jgi:hypothetical protein
MTQTQIFKRKPGRPATGRRPHNICLPLSESEKAQLDAMATRMNTPLATLMRNLIFQAIPYVKPPA